MSSPVLISSGEKRRRGLKIFLSCLAAPVCGLGCAWTEEGFCRACDSVLPELCRCSGGKGNEGDAIHFPNGFLNHQDTAHQTSGLLSLKGISE